MAPNVEESPQCSTEGGHTTPCSFVHNLRKVSFKTTFIIRPGMVSSAAYSALYHTYHGTVADMD